MAESLSLIRTRVPLVRQINDRATSRVTISPTGCRFGICFGPEKKPHSCGQFGTKLLLLMSGGPTLRRLQFPSNVFFATLTRVSRSNIKFRIAFKLGGRGDGPRLLCMNFAGLELAIVTSSIGSKHYLGEEFPKNIAKWLKFGTSLGASRFGQFGSNVVIKCLIMNNGTSLRSSTVFGLTHHLHKSGLKSGDWTNQD